MRHFHWITRPHRHDGIHRRRGRLTREWHLHVLFHHEHGDDDR